MRRLAVMCAVVFVAALGAAVAVSSSGRSAGAAEKPQVVVKVGDRIRVDGHPLGCRVGRKDGRVVLDCRRGGPLAGTYGTMLNSRKAMVVRFSSNDVATVVFEASHRGGARRCR